MRLTRTSRAGIGSAVVAASPFPLALLFKSETCSSVFICLSVVDQLITPECYGLLPFVTFPPIITKPNVHAACYALLRLLHIEPPPGGKGETLSPAFVAICFVDSATPVFRRTSDF